MPKVGDEDGVREIELEELVTMLRPVGVGTPLDLPDPLADVIKAIVVFPDGSVGIQWREPQMATFASARADGAMESIVSDVVMIGRVLYVKVNK